MTNTLGRIDVHTHLLPGLDDGCQSYDQSLACASILVATGYTHAFCTPHVWPKLPKNTTHTITAEVARLQEKLQEAQIPLTVLPGGEINLIWGWPTMQSADIEGIVTYGMERRIALFDFWADTHEETVAKLGDAIKHLTGIGLSLILAHPERVTAFHRDPGAIDWFTDQGVKLQMNTWCLTAPQESPTYRLAHELLVAGKYFLFGTDCHDAESMTTRIEGISVAERLVGREAVDRMTCENPRTLSAYFADDAEDVLHASSAGA